MANPDLKPILDDLDRHIAAMRLTNANLAGDLMDITVEEIKANVAMEKDCNDQPFAQLTDLYQISKGRHFPGRPISVLHGLMMRDDELTGNRRVDHAQASMIYGVTVEAQDEAEWFQDPGNPNQPKREFYGLTLRAIERCDDRIHKAFD